jgi:hypothetical protein
VSLGSISGSFRVRMPPAPASFKVGPLAISRTEISFGEETNISVTVENTGDVAGSYVVTFKINGTPVNTHEVVVEGHATRKVSYDAPGKAPGVYSVDVNGQSASFTVKAWAELPKPMEVDWWLVGGIIAAVVAGASWSSFAIRQRAI